MNPTDLIAQIKESRMAFNRHYQSLPVHALEGPDLSNGWSVKDLLGHISAWEQYLIKRLSGEIPSPISAEAIDSYNDQIYSERKDWTWEEVEYEAQAVHLALLAAIKDLSPAQLSNPDILNLITEGTIEHYQEHEPMLARRAKRWQSERRR